MSVMNRKMFANRDARTKLAGMGGILASSPEMMDATQRFQTGGQGVPRPGTGYGNEIFGEGNIFSNGAGAASGGDMVILGNTVFYVVDNGTVIDKEGTVVRDPSIVQAVIQKVSGEQPQEEFVPPSMGPQVGLDAREGAFQNAGRMSAQEKMLAELSDVDAGMPFEFASSTGVSRDGRTDAEILAEAQAMIAARRPPESEALPDRAPELNNALGLDDARAERGFGRTATMDGLQVPFDTTSELMPTENEVPAQPSPTMQDIMDARSVAENQGGPMGESSAMLAEMTAKKPEGIMATISALAAATDDEKTAILFPDGNRGVPVVQPSEMGPEFNEFGPEGLAARTAAAERDNQERMGLLAARDTEADRMMGINDPVGSSMDEFGPEGLAARTAAAERDNQERMDLLAARDTEAERMMGINDPGGITVADDPSLLDRFKSFDAFGIDAKARNSTVGSALLRATDSVVSSLGGSEFEPQFLGDVPEEVTTTRSEETAALLARLEDPNLSDNERSAINTRLSAIDKLYNVAETLENIVPRALDKGTEIAAGVVGPIASAFDPKLGANILDNRDAAEARLEIDPVKDLEYEAIVDARENAVPPIPVDTTDDARAERTNFSDPVVPPAPEVDPEVDPEVAAPEVDAEKKVGELANKVNENPANAGETVSTTMLDSSGVDTSNMGIKERTVAMKKMLTDLMGQTDADEKEEFWMNMAMIGFGVASGDSQDAMKNIADGLLAGTAQISKGKSDKKARDDKFTLTAYGEVLADERAREKFARDQVLAGIRVSGSDANSFVVSAPDRLYNSTYASAFSNAVENLSLGSFEAGQEAQIAAYQAAPTSSAGVAFAQTSLDQARDKIKNDPKSKAAVIAELKRVRIPTKGLE